MDSEVILENILKKLCSFLNSNYKKNDIKIILSEINLFASKKIVFKPSNEKLSYLELENSLFNINEKQIGRKEKGVYYTDNDITEYIVEECINHIGIENFCEKTIFDPTCGSGEFLLTAFKRKIFINDSLTDKKSIKQIIKTIYGNDLNKQSIFITKLRILLFLLNEYGIKTIKGISNTFNQNFTCNNFFDYKPHHKFDVIIGNPPYVEDKSHSIYGNIYADVLSHVCDCISNDGIIGFIIPLSYVATPRMVKIRKKISDNFNTQYLYNYADRPGCLFTQVHQKLTILIACKTREKKLITGNYQYWYNEERNSLFQKQTNIINQFENEKFIPKLGTLEDKNIYEKIINKTVSLNKIILDSKKNDINNKPSLYLNMRAAFWIKAFLTKHSGNEYKQFSFENEEYRNYFYCLLNSSLFWWFWICISDCWHITNKEIDNFKIPDSFDSKIVKKLANGLDKKLEKTKKYVGTKQTDYEYKHKNCLQEIHAIDDYINNLFGLNNGENDYIKNYSLVYRTSGGIAKCV